MASLRRLAKKELGESRNFGNSTKAVLVPALLEIAHALSRGRKPSSCSLLPGANIQKWLREVFTEVQPNTYNDFDEQCTYVNELQDVLIWDQDNPDIAAILRAIKLCRAHLLPVALPEVLRGTSSIEKEIRKTNLKRKTKWLARRDGSRDDADLEVW
jgi:hypothetical protein